MKQAILLLFATLILSCSPQKRLNRLIEKHPELVTHDTITVQDTVVLPGDTLVMWRETSFTVYDTITFESEREVVRVVRVPTGSPCDTAIFRARILAAVKPDTVFREIKVPCATVQPTKEIPVIPWWAWAVIGALGLVVIYLVGKSMSK